VLQPLGVVVGHVTAMGKEVMRMSTSTATLDPELDPEADREETTDEENR
jgi:hypothetical protein